MRAYHVPMLTVYRRHRPGYYFFWKPETSVGSRGCRNHCPNTLTV